MKWRIRKEVINGNICYIVERKIRFFPLWIFKAYTLNMWTAEKLIDDAEKPEIKYIDK